MTKETDTPTVGETNVGNVTAFDYVQYDEVATTTQATFKSKFIEIHALVEHKLQSPRAKALVKTKLEEAYMWVGKAVRDDQISRGGPTNLQERRNAS